MWRPVVCAVIISSCHRMLPVLFWHVLCSEQRRRTFYSRWKECVVTWPPYFRCWLCNFEIFVSISHVLISHWWRRQPFVSEACTKFLIFHICKERIWCYLIFNIKLYFEVKETFIVATLGTWNSIKSFIVLKYVFFVNQPYFKGICRIYIIHPKAILHKYCCCGFVNCINSLIMKLILEF